MNSWNTNLFNEATIISIVPFPIKETKPGLIPGYFEFAPADDGPQLLHIGLCYHSVYIDSDRPPLRVPDPADLVANSIVNDYINSQLAIGPDCKPGLFWQPGKLRNASEIDPVLLAKNQGDQLNWLTAIAMLADDDFARYQKHSSVSDCQRKAARLIGWKASQHKWMSESTAFNSPACPFCYSTLLHPDATVCANCHRDIKIVLEEEALVA